MLSYWGSRDVVIVLFLVLRSLLILASSLSKLRSVMRKRAHARTHTDKRHLKLCIYSIGKMVKTLVTVHFFSVVGVCPSSSCC